MSNFDKDEEKDDQQGLKSINWNLAILLNAIICYLSNHFLNKNNNK